MKLMSANIQDLRTLYVDSLKKALDMEQKITKALPDMIEKTSDSELSSALREHLEQTRGHVSKVESLLRNANGDVDTSTCKVMSSLSTEAEDMIRDAKDSAICDISIIAACQQVEHHEMAVYGTLRTWAQILGMTNDANVLQSILNQEEQADKILTQVASRVNYQAAA